MPGRGENSQPGKPAKKVSDKALENVIVKHAKFYNGDGIAFDDDLPTICTLLKGMPIYKWEKRQRQFWAVLLYLVVILALHNAG